MVKFMQYYVTNGSEKANVWYSIGNRIDGKKCVTLYARMYDRQLGKILPNDYKNDTDLMTDYFDKGQVTLFEDHPLYLKALERALINEEKRKQKVFKQLERHRSQQACQNVR